MNRVVPIAYTGQEKRTIGFHRRFPASKKHSIASNESNSQMPVGFSFSFESNMARNIDSGPEDDRDIVDVGVLNVDVLKRRPRFTFVLPKGYKCVASWRNAGDLKFARFRIRTTLTEVAAPGSGFVSRKKGHADVAEKLACNGGRNMTVNSIGPIERKRQVNLRNFLARLQFERYRSVQISCARIIRGGVTRCRLLRRVVRNGFRAKR